MEAAAFGLEFTCALPSFWDMVVKTACPNSLLHGLHYSIVLSYNVRMLLNGFQVGQCMCVEGGGFDTKPLKLVLQLFCNFSVL